jgi:1-acyl-sn-glycerol-3-phosphate acyltransferase
MSEGDPRTPEVPPVEADAEDLAALQDALEDLRREIRERFGRRAPQDEAAQPEGAAPGPAWDELLGELRRRLSTFGMSERSGEVDEFGMDEVVLRRARPLLDFLCDRYWRVDLDGLRRLPAKGPCLLVANRSGLLPYDGLVISHSVERFHTPGQRPRFFVADWLMTLPFVQPYLARLGGVRACRENAERLLDAGHFVVVFPEGAKGATKVFRERYRLKRFGRGGVVRVALESGAPLVPVGVVGAEEAHPILFKATAPGRVLGLPFLPVTPTFPLLGPLGVLPLPSKWVIRIGEPLPLTDLEPDASRDEVLLSRLTEELRARIQQLVQQGLAARESIWA